MDEREIEMRVEVKMNTLDRQFRRGAVSQSEYDQAIKDLDKWANEQYAKRRK